MNGDKLKKEFGDYQTPEDFAYIICKYLHDNLKINPQKIIEPTSGVGNFLQASIKEFNSCKKFIGIEINKKYCEICKTKISDKRLKIKCQNFFEYDLNRDLDKNLQTLIIGNPPWATNSNLNFNLPNKTNVKKFKGIEAITGASNFDICEYIISKIIDCFKNTNSTIAMLCKTSVARNILQELNRGKIKANSVKILNFDASKIFKINASACLFIISLSDKIIWNNLCEVSNLKNPNKILYKIKCEKNSLSSLLGEINNEANNFDGQCQLTWRQGVKHDCADVMELKHLQDKKYENKKNEKIELEDMLVFPLIKSSNFKAPMIYKDFQKFVIVTQKKVNEETSKIKNIAPKTWKYLWENKELFEKRKSTIYQNAPMFSMFGVGDYSYSKYKVGISGFYKKPLFSLLFNKKNINHPIMLDDTTYFLSFDKYDSAYACMILLNSKAIQDFLYSISFKDAKRPYTKKILQRLDLKKCVEKISLQELKETECKLNLKSYINQSIYQDFKRLVN